MSKSVTASAPKNPASLPTKSAWAKGPPLNATSAPTRSQSPSINATQPNTPTHSRKPSALGGTGAAFKDGVSVPRSIQPSQKPAAGISFGSITEPQAPLSSSPAAVPPISSDVANVKSYGSIPATNGASAKPAAATQKSPLKSDIPSASPSTTPTKLKLDVKSFFRTPAPAAPSVDASPTLPRAVPPNQPLTQPQQQQQPQHGYYSRPPNQPAPTPNTNNTGAPRSPQYTRQMSNGAPSRGPNSAGLGPSSPRLSNVPGPHQLPPHASQHPGMPPPPPPMAQPWNPYYYSFPMHDPNVAYPQMYSWQPSGLPPQMQHPPPLPQQQQPQQPHLSHPLPSPSRPPPPQLHQNGAPPSHAPASPYHPYAHPHPQSSPPPGTPQTPNPARLSTQAPAFVPNKRTSSAIKIRNPNSGEAVDLSAVASPIIGPSEGVTPPQARTPPGHQRKPTVVRMESEEARKKRVEEEQREKDQLEKERRERDEQERTAKLYRDVEEKKRKRKEEEERVRKENEERELMKKREEEERRKREEEERKERERKEEEQREEERREEERREKERIHAEEERERARKEEEGRKQREEEERERARKAEEEEKERLRKVEEEAAAAAAAAKARAEAEEQERLRKEAEEREKEKAFTITSTTATSIASTAASSPSPTPSLTAPKPASPSQADLPKSSKRPIPGPLDLSATSRPGLPPSLPSALATARAIENLDKIQYPEGFSSPKPELNAGASNGKFRYDRDFLLQFMAICKEKPDSLPPLDAIGLEPSDQGSIGRSRGNARINSMAPPAVPSGRTTSGGIGLGIMPYAGKVGPSTMGNFATSKGTSEERFAASTMGRSTSVGGPAGNVAFPARPTPMVRTASQGGSTPAQPSSLGPSGRTRSQRGGKRHDSNKVGVPPAMQERERSSSTFGSGMAGSGLGFEPVAPLVASENRWTAQSMARRVVMQDMDPGDVVERKVKALLNKLTMERFDSISDQIIQWANRSEKEKDGRTLIQVIRLVFEKATDEAAWSEMYARLCRKMMEQISQNVQDDGIRNSDGKPIAGGQLFRKYLLNRCQEDFERGWSVKEASARAAESKAADDKAAKDAADEAKASGKGTGEEVLYSDEYYAAQKAKRQGLGLVKFIGELFKLSMLTERIMHECIKKLLGNVENPEEEEIESLCKLLSTVGQQLDNVKARSHMDVYFQRMKELSKSSNITSRMQYMLLDVIELRDRKWVSRTFQAAPTTIAAVHEQAAKDQAKAQIEKDQAVRNMGRDPMSRSGSRRGEHRGGYGSQPGPDGWTSVASAPPRPPPTVGDLTQFGKIAKSAGGPMTFGPSSVFTKKDPKREASLSRTNSTQNMFAMLNSEAAAEPPVVSKSSRPPSRKPSADFTQAGLPEAPQRKKLLLLPRSVTASEETKVDEESAAPSEASEDEVEPTLTEAQANAKIDEDLKEFWAIRNLEEADAYFPALPTPFKARFVEKLVANALERKEGDAKLVADFFSRAAEKDLCPVSSFEDGLTPHMEFFDDVAIDVPAAYKLMAILLKGSKLPKSKVEELAGKIAVDGEPGVPPKVKLMKEYAILDSP